MADLTINLAAICTPADYNTRPLDTIYSNFIDALPVVCPLGDVDVFPEVTLSFAGGLKTACVPSNFFLYLVLKDKVVVYDLVRQRIGWAEYDCSLEVNVSASRGGRSKDVISTGQWGEFNVQIDTGGDVLWVSCTSCNGCPKTSELQIQISFFDPGVSSSASLVSCSDRRCYSNFQTESALLFEQSLCLCV